MFHLLWIITTFYNGESDIIHGGGETVSKNSLSVFRYAFIFGVSFVSTAFTGQYMAVYSWGQVAKIHLTILI